MPHERYAFEAHVELHRLTTRIKACNHSCLSFELFAQLSPLTNTLHAIAKLLNVPSGFVGCPIERVIHRVPLLQHRMRRKIWCCKKP